VIKISSIGGQTFLDIAKSKVCQCEIYSDYVAPIYSTDILALTWGRPLVCPSRNNPRKYKPDFALFPRPIRTANQNINTT